MVNSCVLRLLLNWMPNIADSTCKEEGEKLRPPDLHAIIAYCRTKSARIAPSNTVTDLNTRFFCRKPNFISIYWFGHPNPRQSLSHYRSIPCLNTMVGRVRYHNFLLKYSLLFYIELYPTFFHCWPKLSPNIFLNYTVFNILPSNSQFQ